MFYIGVFVLNNSNLRKKQELLLMLLEFIFIPALPPNGSTTLSQDLHEPLQVLHTADLITGIRNTLY